MARILLFAADIVPLTDLPASGGGIRALQLTRMLTAAGHEVVVSAPTHTYLGRRFRDRLSPEQIALSFSERPQDEIYREVDPELVIFASNWLSIDGDWWPEVPTILDLCGPVLIESALVSGFDRLNLEVLLQRKIRALARADLLLCGGERQQWYFRQLLLFAGYDITEPAPMILVPIGVDPDWIQPRPYPAEPIFVYSGGLYPWQDPTLALRVILEEIQDRGRGRFVWYGRSHDVAESDRQRFRQCLALIEACPRAEHRDYLNLGGIIEALRGLSVSVELMARNVERELALTTRTPMALALGLPVLYGDYAELAGPIAARQAGWVVPDKDIEATRQTIRAILDEPGQVAERGARAQDLARDQFSWDRLGDRLLRFVAEPKARASKLEDPALSLSPERLTRGERWLLKMSRARGLSLMRRALQPFFRKRK